MVHAAPFQSDHILPTSSLIFTHIFLFSPHRLYVGEGNDFALSKPGMALCPHRLHVGGVRDFALSPMMAVHFSTKLLLPPT